jgi:hypothetical protein
MDALDGNAIAGLLREIFGEEMTTAVGVCGNCGASGPVAETNVYLQAPGVVVRCRSCTSIVMVLATVRGVTSVDLRGLSSLEAP